MLYKKTRFILLATALLILSFACAKSEASNEKKDTELPKKEAVSKIYVEVDIEEIADAKQGDEISVSLQDGSAYTLRINRIEETMPGIVSISADIENKETGQAMLILRDGKLAGSINMYADGVSYKLDYDTEAERHFIAEIDPDTKDVLQGGEPLTPKKND